MTARAARPVLPAGTDPGTLPVSALAGVGPALFGRSTRAALEQGARYTAAAAVDRAVEEARALLHRSPLVVITGGGARELRPLIRSESREVPDLVLWGLAVWAREG